MSHSAVIREASSFSRRDLLIQRAHSWTICRKQETLERSALSGVSPSIPPLQGSENPRAEEVKSF